MAFLAMLAAGDRVLMILATLVLLLALVRSRQILIPLLRRSRWLLISIGVLFGWMTPGMPVPGIPGLTDSGANLALMHAVKLLLAIAWVALLLDYLKFPQLLAGFRCLLHPLQRFGLDIHQGVLRLAMTMELLKTETRWSLDSMAPAPLPAERDSLPDVVRIEVVDLSVNDLALMFLASLLMLVVIWS